MAIMQAPLAGERITLRAPTVQDLPLFVRWANDPDVLKHTIVHPVSEEKEREWLHEKMADPTYYLFLMEINETGKPIGNCTLKRKVGEEGWCAGLMIGDKDEWGKGYGPDAMRLLLAYARDFLKADRVWLTVDTVHARAIRAYEKCGFSLMKTQHNSERIHSNQEEHVMEIRF